MRYLSFVTGVVSALAALAIYGERIDGWTIMGALLILAANYWSVREEARPSTRR